MKFILILLTILLNCKKESNHDKALIEYINNFKKKILLKTQDCKLEFYHPLIFVFCNYNRDTFIVYDITFASTEADYLILIEDQTPDILKNENYFNLLNSDSRILFRWEKNYDKNHFHDLVRKVKMNQKEILFFDKKDEILNNKPNFISGITVNKFKGLKEGKEYKLILSHYQNHSWHGEIKEYFFTISFKYNPKQAKPIEIKK